MKLPSPSSAHAVIAVSGLTRRFGGKTALNDVSVFVPGGSVLGLVGENGAGKTTLIKHLLGMLKAETGTVRLFGLDPVADPVGVLARVGYLSERRDLPGWMRIEEYLRYTQAFYPGWDEAYADMLLEQFELDPRQKIKTLSQGQQAKTGLLTALAYRPELLILDEPSSGLDPLVRRVILEAIIEAVAEAGRTVLFSSHLLDEVERVADQIVLLKNGRVLLHGRTDEVRANHISAVIAFTEPQTTMPRMDGACAITGFGQEWRVLFSGSRLELAMAVLTSKITWLITLVMFFLWLILCGNEGFLAQLVRLAQSKPGSLFLLFLTLWATFVLVTWQNLVSGIWIGLSGRLKFVTEYNWLRFAGYLGLFVLAKRAWNQPESQVVLKQWLPWILAAILLVKLLCSSAAFLWSLRHKAITPGAICWMVASWIGCGLFIAVVAGRACMELRIPLAGVWTPLASFLLPPLAALALAPVALTWNRHR